VPRSRKRGPIHPLPHTSSCCNPYLFKHRDNFTFKYDLALEENSRLAYRQLIPFAGIDFYEIGFSMGKKGTETSNAAPDLRIQFSHIRPNIKRICEEETLFALKLAICVIFVLTFNFYVHET
jgi:hypothetical protein